MEDVVDIMNVWGLKRGSWIFCIKLLVCLCALPYRDKFWYALFVEGICFGQPSCVFLGPPVTHFCMVGGLDGTTTSKAGCILSIVPERNAGRLWYDERFIMMQRLGF